MQRNPVLLATAVLLGLLLGFLWISGRRSEPDVEGASAATEAAPEPGPPAVPAGEAIETLDDPARRAADGAVVGNARIIVRTLGPGGAPIAGATVLLGSAVLGTTDSSGEIGVWRSRAERSVQVGALAEGMGPVHRTLYAPVPDRIDLVLAPACGLSGVVIAKGRGSAPAGALVAVWPKSLRVSQERIERVLASPDREPAGLIRVVPTDAEGRFRIDGLAAELPYVLTAGAQGWVAERRVTVERACDHGQAALVLQPLYGALLDLRDAAGEPLKVALEVLVRMTWGLGDEGSGETLWGEAPDVALCGLDLARARARGLRPHLAVSDLELQRIGPMRITCDAFGYAPGTFEVWLERASTSLPVHPLDMTETAAAWGDLTVRLEGCPAPCSRAGASAAGHLRLSLLPLEGEPRIAHLKVENGAQTLRVPQGRYFVHPALSDGLYRTPRQAVDVGASGAVAFSLADLGCIEIQPDFGARDSGHAALGVRVKAEGQPVGSEVTLYIDEPPYLLSGLLPGRYEVEVVFPEEGGFAPAVVEVRAGTRTDLRMLRAF